MRYFIGIIGISTAGKSTLAATLLSSYISPAIFPIPHTTRRQPRSDDDSRLIRCISEEKYLNEDFLTVDQNYGTLNSDYKNFLDSMYFAAVSVVSCNEVFDLRKKILNSGLTPVFVSLTLTEMLEKEINEIEKRFPNYFSGEALEGRIQRDKDLAKDFFFNKQYLERNNVISLSQEGGDVLEWINNLQNYLPISYHHYLEDYIKEIKLHRKRIKLLDLSEI